jgi:hypothetical protein
MSIKPGSKYYPLYLQGCDQEAVTLTVAEIEALVGDSLPDSARKKRNWWSNRDSPKALQAGAWVSGGYRPGCERPRLQSRQGNPGDLCPPGAKQQLAPSGPWVRAWGANFPRRIATLALI